MKKYTISQLLELISANQTLIDYYSSKIVLLNTVEKNELHKTLQLLSTQKDILFEQLFNTYNDNIIN